MKEYKSIIDSLDTEKICRYLTNTSWQSLPDLLGGKIRQFQSEDGEEVVLVPLSNSFTDYYREIKETLSIIASVEGKSFEELTNKLLNPSQDILKWKIADGLTSRGVIPFNSMIENIEHIKDLLASSILDITSPSKFHTRLNTKEVNSHLSNYQFGQTEVGSYILNILCPLGYYQYNLFNPEQEELPLGRKVNIKILNGISKIQSSITARSTELQDTLDEGIMSVNFLSAIAKLYDENIHSNISLRADWNAFVPLTSEITISQVELDVRCYEPLLNIIESNSPNQEQNIEKSFCGKISLISGDAEAENREIITIVVAAIDDDLRKINVKVELNCQHYLSFVTEAFESGANVIVTGLMSRTTKSIKLTNASIKKIDL